jgi:hypothetical protein
LRLARRRPAEPWVAGMRAFQRAGSAPSKSVEIPATPPQPNRGTTDKTPVHPSERDLSDGNASVPSNAPTPMICLT